MTNKPLDSYEALANRRVTNASSWKPEPPDTGGLTVSSSSAPVKVETVVSTTSLVSNSQRYILLHYRIYSILSFKCSKKKCHCIIIYY